MNERKLAVASAVTGAAFVLYYCAMSLAELEIARGFALVWPIAGISLILCAAKRRRVAAFFGKPLFKKPAFRIPVAVFAALFLSISLVFFARIVSVPNSRTDSAGPGDPPKYVIVLGGGIHRDGRVSRTLEKRLETAAAFARENPDATLVVTGGQLPREREPEADAMARWLVERAAVEPGRILRERMARDTIQNFAYSLDLIESELSTVAEPAIAVTTSDFHMNRSLFLARRAGIPTVVPLPAPSPALQAPTNYLRETGAWWKLSIRLVLEGNAAAIIDLIRG